MSSSSVPCLADRLLIEQVRLHEVLYAVTTKSNRDNQLRDRAWIEIASTLDRSGKTHICVKHFLVRLSYKILIRL